MPGEHVTGVTQCQENMLQVLQVFHVCNICVTRCLYQVTDAVEKLTFLWVD